MKIILWIGILIPLGIAALSVHRHRYELAVFYFGLFLFALKIFEKDITR